MGQSNMNQTAHGHQNSNDPGGFEHTHTHATFYSEGTFASHWAISIGPLLYVTITWAKLMITITPSHSM